MEKLSMSPLPDYQDHIGLWAGELKSWLPDGLFDAHVHLGPPEIVARLSLERKNLAVPRTIEHLPSEQRARHNPVQKQSAPDSPPVRRFPLSA